MEIKIRHLSGSKAGQEHTFSQDRVTIGRNPTNDVSFDPHADSIVSGVHAELTSRNDGWMLRDLGSSNGTFINEQRVTEHLLRPQEVVQLGKNGPRLQCTFELPSGVAIPPPSPGNAPVEGRTVMMMMNEGAAAPAAAGPAGFSAPAHPAPAYAPSSAPVKKKGGLLRALLVVILVLGFLMVAGLAAVIYTRSRSRASEAAARSTTGTQQPTSTAVAETGTEATETSAAAAMTTETGATQTGSPVLTTAATSTDSPVAPSETSATPATVAELEQQLARSQKLIDGLQRQLQEKNDTLEKTTREKDAAIRRAIGQRNAALRRAREAEARAAQQAQPQSFLVPNRRSKPVQIAGILPPSLLASLALQADAESAGDAEGELMKNKTIKKRIAYLREDAEIPLPGMPPALPASLGRLVIQSLASTGDYVAVNKSGDAAISVVVTNYKSDVKEGVNTDKVARGVGSVSRIFGGPNISTPAGVKSVSMDADMTARVKLLDPDNIELGEVFAEAASKNRETSLDVGSLDINQIGNTDTALGDVTRKVAADAVEYLLAELQNVDWKGGVTRFDKKTNTIIVNCGTRCQIESGDVFSIHDGSEEIGTARVTKVTADTATAEITSGEGDMRGKTVRYEGRTDDSPLTRKSGKTTTLKTREAGTAHAGPGMTFAEVRKLKAGTNLDFVYSVGSWAKVSDGSTSFWIPLSNAQITG